MKSRWNSLMVGGCNVVGLALLALSATAGGSAVRADDPSTLQSTVLEKIVSGLEQQVANLGASVAAFADSFTAKRIAAQELCVADSSGAQTCITKAQLDALLRGAIQLGQAPAAPDLTEQTASTDKSVAPGDAVAAVVPPEAPPAIEQSDVPLPVVRPQAAERSVGETAEAIPEVAAVMPSAAEPAAGQAPAASSEAAAPLPAEASAPPASEPAETIIAANAKAEPPVTADRPARDEEGVTAGPSETDAATPELKAVPAEAPPASERLE